MDRLTDLRFLSLGWGVQSFTLAAMAAVGELDPLTVAVHADTHHEYAATYRFAERWSPWLEARGVPVVRVAAHPNKELGYQLRTYNAVSIPAFMPAPPGRRKRKAGQLNRHCTQDWKVRPIQRLIRATVPRHEVGTLLLGISRDEWERQRTSKVGYVRHAYPLVEREMTRADWVDWLNRHGLEVPPKSACVFCPLHDARMWAELKDAGGPDWARAVQVDGMIRDARPFPVYVHPSLRPLADLRTLLDEGYEQPSLPGCGCWTQ